MSKGHEARKALREQIRNLRKAAVIDANGLEILPVEKFSKRKQKMDKTVQAAATGQPNGAVAAADAAATAPRLYFYGLEGFFSIFSNFSRNKVTVDGVEYATSEHYYQSQKYDGVDPISQRIIAKLAEPSEAAALGRDKRYPIRADWNEIKDSVMLKVLRVKFMRGDWLTYTLLRTGDHILIEDTTDDYYWGIGRKGDGQNMLGKLLMQVRDELRAAGMTVEIANSKLETPDAEMLRKEEAEFTRCFNLAAKRRYVAPNYLNPVEKLEKKLANPAAAPYSYGGAYYGQSDYYYDGGYSDAYYGYNGHAAGYGKDTAPAKKNPPAPKALPVSSYAPAIATTKGPITQLKGQALADATPQARAAAINAAFGKNKTVLSPIEEFLSDEWWFVKSKYAAERVKAFNAIFNDDVAVLSGADQALLEEFIQNARLAKAEQDLLAATAAEKALIAENNRYAYNQSPPPLEGETQGAYLARLQRLSDELENGADDVEAGEAGDAYEGDESDEGDYERNAGMLKTDEAGYKAWPDYEEEGVADEVEDDVAAEARRARQKLLDEADRIYTHDIPEPGHTYETNEFQYTFYQEYEDKREGIYYALRGTIKGVLDIEYYADNEEDIIELFDPYAFVRQFPEYADELIKSMTKYNMWLIDAIESRIYD